MPHINRLIYLDDFINKQLHYPIPRSEWVYFPGFDALYIRYGPMYIDHEKYLNVFTYANSKAIKNGGHTTEKLLKHIIVTYPMTPYFLFECVLNDHLKAIIEKLGFKVLSSNMGINTYYLDYESLKKSIK